MNICVDVGNTEIKISFYKNDKMIDKLSLLTDSSKTEDEFYASLDLLLKVKNIPLNEEKNLIYCSVVPSINLALSRAIKRIFNPDKVIDFKDKLKTSLPMKVDNPSEVGTDLIADMVGAKEKYGFPSLVIDLGTATKILLLDKDGYFSSGVIVPGLMISAMALSSKGEQLPSINLEMPKKVIARNTIDSMKVGVVLGHYESIKGLINQTIKELKYQPKIIFTGGYSNVYKEHLDESFIYDEDLLSYGLNSILKKNLGE